MDKLQPPSVLVHAGCSSLPDERPCHLLDEWWHSMFGCHWACYQIELLYLSEQAQLAKPANLWLREAFYLPQKTCLAQQVLRSSLAADNTCRAFYVLHCSNFACSCTAPFLVSEQQSLPAAGPTGACPTLPVCAPTIAASLCHGSCCKPFTQQRGGLWVGKPLFATRGVNWKVTTEFISDVFAISRATLCIAVKQQGLLAVCFSGHEPNLPLAALWCQV